MTTTLTKTHCAKPISVSSHNYIDTMIHPSPELPDVDVMQNAMLSSDASYDGVFFTCVRTTGIFCRPSCRARKPRPDRVAYHRTVRDCLLAGFRPCKRCRPLAVDGAPPDWMNELLECVESNPSGRISDSDIKNMGVSPHRVRRYFMQHFDMTFQAYHRSRRMGMALIELRNGVDPLHVAMRCGYESQSGFRDAFEQTFGTTPGRNADISAIITRPIETPIGPMLAGATDDGICLLEFADRRALQRQIETLKKRMNAAIVAGNNDHLNHLSMQLDVYFSCKNPNFDVPLVMPGTDFQQRVWTSLMKIPMGITTSYRDIAQDIDQPSAHRAVARANGDNRIAILIPCHRVIRSDGTLSGYGGGVWRKKRLLEIEQQIVS